jgi:long-chain acyl-CoA synthetase
MSGDFNVPIERDAVVRLLSSFLRAQIAALRCGSEAGLPAAPWPESLALDVETLGIDSLERLNLAMAANDAFHLRDSGLEDYLLRRRTLGGWADTLLACWAERTQHISFATSGSTGPPKLQRHALADLAREADVFASLFTDRRRIVAAVPAHHIYGFIFTVLLPGRLGVPVLDCGDPDMRFSARDFVPGDLVVAAPDRWRLLERFGVAPPVDVWGVSSTAPTPATTILALRAQGFERMVEVYGSSETGGIGLRDDPADAYALLPPWRSTMVDAGRLLIRSHGDDGAGREMAIEPPDHLDWIDDHRFRPIRRRDEAIQIGGHNVFPSRVAALLKTHAAVADCAVRPMTEGPEYEVGGNTENGVRLKAFIVPADFSTPEPHLQEELMRWMRERLTPPETPKSVTLGRSLPVGPMGKAADW